MDENRLDMRLPLLASVVGFVFTLFIFWRGKNDYDVIVEVLHMVFVIGIIFFAIALYAQAYREEKAKPFIVVAVLIAMYFAYITIVDESIGSIIPKEFPVYYAEVKNQLFAEIFYAFISVLPLALVGLYIIERLLCHAFLAGKE